MYAESRLIDNISEKIKQSYQLLAGEPFSLGTAITSLSGGQSRVLMIADVSCLSASPVVLIDEIENAGIDRVKAVSLLLNNEKIILTATHDPLLAQSCGRRIVIKSWVFCGKGFEREDTWFLTKVTNLRQSRRLEL